ncbi:MAG: hypothetical protein KJ556_20830 [Gammaproteobacteria bacterium]|nr:hypothetical protein [Gammaproteobacteria bacterium]
MTPSKEASILKSIADLRVAMELVNARQDELLSNVNERLRDLTKKVTELTKEVARNQFRIASLEEPPKPTISNRKAK